MAEIAREVGRSPSTLHQWAAAGGWRIVELEAEGFASLSDAPAHPGRRSSLVPDKPETLRARSRACPFPDREGDGSQPETESACDLTPLEAAKALHQRSADLASAGQIRAAEDAARLADRILRTEYHLGRVGGPPVSIPPEDGANEINAALTDRIRRINRVYQERKAAGDPEAEKSLPPAVYIIAELTGYSVNEVLSDPAQVLSQRGGVTQ